MDKKMTKKEAYIAMLIFLNIKHKKYGIKEIGEILGGMQLLKDGEGSADPAFFTDDWNEAISKVDEFIPGIKWKE